MIFLTIHAVLAQKQHKFRTAIQNASCLKKENCKFLGCQNLLVNLTNLLHNRYSEKHKVTVKVDINSIGVLFTSHKMTSLMKSYKQFRRHFYIVPKIFYQLFTISCFYREHTIPVNHILSNGNFIKGV